MWTLLEELVAFDVAQGRSIEITGVKKPKNRQKRQTLDAQGDHLSRVDLGPRSRWLWFVASNTARRRALWRQRLRNDLAMAHSSLCQQSVLARSLELERSTSGASEVLPYTVAT
jgi:hypothetical protein